MRFIEMFKDGIIKLTVEKFVNDLKAKGWERVVQQHPQSKTVDVVAKTRRKNKEKQ